MKKRVAFNSAKRTAQFATIQDNIAKLFNSSSSECSSEDTNKTEAKKRQRVKEAKRKLDEKKVKRTRKRY